MTGTTVSRIAIRDGKIIWHVQTTPASSLGGIMTGAWESEDPTPFLHDAVLLPVSADDAIPGVPSTSLDLLVDAVHREVLRLRQVVKVQVESNPSLKALRIPDVVRPDPEELAKSFTGEPQARRAWSYAMAVAELVQEWAGLESQRRSRKYLQEESGAEHRAMPVPTVSSGVAGK